MKPIILFALIFLFHITAFAQTEQPIKTWSLAKSSNPDIASLLFTPGGFLVVGDGKDVRLLNTQSNKDVWLKGHGKDVSLLALNEDGLQLLSTSADNEAKLWNLKTFQEIPMEDHSKKEKKGGKAWDIVREGVQYLPNSKVKDGIYKADNIKRKSENIGDFLRPKDRKFNPLKALDFADFNGYRCAYFVCDIDKAFEVVTWRVGSTVFETSLTLPKSAYATDRIVFSPSGKLLGYNYSESSTVKIWNLETRKEMQTISFAKRLLTFSPSNRLVVTASDEGILFWDIEEGINTRFLETDKKQDVRAFCFDNKDRYFAAATTDSESGDNQIILWDADSGKRIRTFNASDKVAEGTLSFSPDGNFLAYRTIGDVVELWDIQQMMNENRQNLGKNLLPKVEWEAPLSNLTTPTDAFDLKACIASSSKIKDVKIYVNDRLVNGQERGLKPVANPTACAYPLSMNVRLRQGANTIYVAATNMAGSRYSESRYITVGNNDKTKELMGRQIALVIGNADYLNGGKLTNPVNDANDLSATLQGLGFEVIQKTNADLRTLEQGVEEFSKKLRYYDVALVFYAGHGLQVDGENYLVPTDALMKEKADVRYKCLPLGMLLSKMEGKAKTNIVVLDACRNNPFERSWSRNSSGNGMAVVSAPKGTFIGFATSPGQTANDGTGKNGTYTTALLRHLTTKSITIDQLFTRINSTVDEMSSGSQVPWKTSSLVGDYYFSK